MKMKTIFLAVCLIFILLFTGMVFSSVCRTLVGTFKTEEFTLTVVTNEWSGFYSNGTGYSGEDIQFDLRANDRYLISKESDIYHDQQYYYFESEEDDEMEFFKIADQLTIDPETIGDEIFIQITIVFQNTYTDEINTVSKELKIIVPDTFDGELEIIETGQ